MVKKVRRIKISSKTPVTKERKVTRRRPKKLPVSDFKCPICKLEGEDVTLHDIDGITKDYGDARLRFEGAKTVFNLKFNIKNDKFFMCRRCRARFERAIAYDNELGKQKLQPMCLMEGCNHPHKVYKNVIVGVVYKKEGREERGVFLKGQEKGKPVAKLTVIGGGKLSYDEAGVCKNKKCRYVSQKEVNLI